MEETTTANTTAPLSPPIVEEYDNKRVIQLSATCYTDDFTVKQHVARFTSTCGVNFIKLNSDEKKPKKYYLRHDEMEALVAGWAQYKADIQAKEEAEKARQQAIIKEAYELAQTCPAINVKASKDGKDEEVAWLMTIPELHYNTGYYETAYTADNFLSDVKEAVEAWQKHLKQQEQLAAEKAAEDKLIAEAQAIADACPALSFERWQQHWRVTLIQPQGQPDHTHAHTPGQLLAAVKRGYAQYDQWQQAAQQEPAETPLQG